MARELVFERARPKLDEYLRVYVVYDDLTGLVTSVETDRQGMANYDVHIRIIRAGLPNIVDRRRGGVPALDLQHHGLIVNTAGGRGQRRVGWRIAVKMTTPDEFRPPGRQGAGRG